MLSDKILKTLEYFDVQEHPLTLIEISRYLLADKTPQAREYALSEILSALEELQEKVQNKHGFYFLKGKEEIAKRRLENNYYSSPRLKRVKKYLPRTRYIPFISAVALTGSEAINNSKQGSDIDLLVLTQPNRIWLGRLFITMYFQIFGVRRYGDKVQNRFCLNHYIQEQKEIDREKHIYTAVEYISLIPYFGGDKIYQFQKENLRWIKEYLAQPNITPYHTPRPSKLKIAFEYLLNNLIGDALEKFAGLVQKKRIKIQDSIVVQDDELSFHPGNKGRQVLSKLNWN